MLTEKDYCDYDTCVALAKLKFPRWELPYDILSKKYCLRLYDAQKWLREKKHLHIEVRWYGNMWYEYEVKEAEGKVIAEGCAFPTYEEALRTAVYMATEHLKGK